MSPPPPSSLLLGLFLLLGCGGATSGITSTGEASSGNVVPADGREIEVDVAEVDRAAILIEIGGGKVVVSIRTPALLLTDDRRGGVW